MKRPEIQRKGVCLPTYHLVGQISSGKSHSGIHMQCLMPCIKSGENSYSVRSDPNVTEYVLKDIMTTECPVLVLDPPPQFPKKANLNSFLDHCFQGNAQKTRYDKTDKCLSTGVLFIWAHEKSTLPDCQPTALSKCFLGVHGKSEDFDCAKNGQLHQDLLDNCYNMSGFFREMVLPLDVKELTRLQYQKTTEASVLMSARSDKSTLLSYDRVISNHCLISAASDLVLARLAPKVEWTKRYSNQLMNHIVQRSLPAAFTALKVGTKGTIDTHMHVSDEELMRHFLSYLKQLPIKVFFEIVALNSSEIVFANTILKSRTEFGRILEQSNNYKRTYFVHTDSDKPWFKRNNGNKCAYGKCNYAWGFALQFTELNQQLLDLIRENVKKLMEAAIPSDTANACKAVTVPSDIAHIRKAVTEFFDLKFISDLTSTEESYLDHEIPKTRSEASVSTMTNDQVVVTTEDKCVQADIADNESEDIDGLKELLSLYKQMSKTQRLFTLNGAASLLQGNTMKVQDASHNNQNEEKENSQFSIQQDDEDAQVSPEVETKESETVAEMEKTDSVIKNKEPEPVVEMKEPDTVIENKELEPVPTEKEEDTKEYKKKELGARPALSPKDENKREGEKPKEDYYGDHVQVEMQSAKGGGQGPVKRGRGRGRGPAGGGRGTRGTKVKAEILRSGNRSGGPVGQDDENEVCKTVMEGDIPNISDCSAPKRSKK